MVISLICLINLPAIWFYTCRYYKAMSFDRSSTTGGFFVVSDKIVSYLTFDFVVYLNVFMK